MGTFTPQVHATACVAGEAISSALQEWRDGTGAAYWPARASEELGGIEQALRAARRNLQDGAASTLSPEEALRTARAYLHSIDLAIAEGLRDLTVPLFFLVGEISKELDCPQELYTVLMFYQNM